MTCLVGVLSVNVISSSVLCVEQRRLGRWQPNKFIQESDLTYIVCDAAGKQTRGSISVGPERGGLCLWACRSNGGEIKNAVSSRRQIANGHTEEYDPILNGRLTVCLCTCVCVRRTKGLKDIVRHFGKYKYLLSC